MLLKECRDLFDQYDEDDSGSIDAEEITAAMRYMGREPTAEEITRVIERLGTNGGINFDTFCTIMGVTDRADAMSAAAMTTLCEDVFARYDRDRSQAISMADMSACLRCLGRYPTAVELTAVLEDVGLADQRTATFPQFAHVVERTSVKPCSGRPLDADYVLDSNLEPKQQEAIKNAPDRGRIAISGVCCAGNDSWPAAVAVLEREFEFPVSSVSFFGDDHSSGGRPSSAAQAGFGFGRVRISNSLAWNGMVAQWRGAAGERRVRHMMQVLHLYT